METEAINNLIKWLRDGCNYLSQSSDYAKGYRNGCLETREIVKTILLEAGIKAAE